MGKKRIVRQTNVPCKHCLNPKTNRIISKGRVRQVCPACGAQLGDKPYIKNGAS